MQKLIYCIGLNFLNIDVCVTFYDGKTPFYSLIHWNRCSNERIKCLWHSFDLGRLQRQ